MRPIQLALALCLPLTAWGQGTRHDYERAASLGDQLGPLVLGQPSAPVWLRGANRFWYHRTVDGGREWMLVDADAATQRPLFDQGRLAAALSTATGDTIHQLELPFATPSAQLRVTQGADTMTFRYEGGHWRCTLATYHCERLGPEPEDARPTLPERPRPSPDRQWEAFIRNYNVALRRVGAPADSFIMLSHDGSEGNYYTIGSLRWSPNSQKLMAYRRVPGYDRRIPYIESAPRDQLQPRSSDRFYRKPGDVVDLDRPVLFDIATRRQVVIDNTLFPNAYHLRFPRWWEDSRGFTFEYNERGHMNYRVIEVDANTGAARALIDERPSTFFNYDGAYWRHDVNDGREILWRSERDGWKHLWLYDTRTGRARQVTRGEWVVRGVDSVDAANRQIWFRAGGMHPGRDPYLMHHYRIGFDGSGLVHYTPGDGNHSVSWSPDRAYYVDTWSRVDQPTVMELRRTSDRAVLAELTRVEVTRLAAAGWRAPEVFTAKGRDGVTDIWGVIIRPTNFDSTRSYPVIENIYAGPQGSFVPKNFGLQLGMQSLAELGFVVVQIDGMGTNNRSKAFHDVAWRNLGDAGFPDRILWHRAVAGRYEWYDTTRVGIYGTSAGGQSSTGALLFHPEFYDVAVSAVGCHDNRMDKIWWNELWMSWPLSPHYETSSNVVNAHRLEGRLMLIVGEMDTNVDPTSTLQVVDALVRANKDAELVFIPGMGHGSGGPWGTRKRNDFFVRYLLGIDPPDWNAPTRPNQLGRVGLHDADRLDAWLDFPPSEAPPLAGEWR